MNTDVNVVIRISRPWYLDLNRFSVRRVAEKLTSLCLVVVSRALQVISRPRAEESPVAVRVRLRRALLATRINYSRREVATMSDTESSHLRLQQQIDCQLEVKPQDVLAAWEKAGWNEEPGTDGDEAPLKYLALVLLEAIEERAVRLSVDKDKGVTIFGASTYRLPKAPASYIARGLEILREIAGMEGPGTQGKISLGVRNDSLDLIIQKEAGLHIINIPGVSSV